MNRTIRVGSRESRLAMSQSQWVINEIKKKFPYLKFELVGMKTKGDIILDEKLDKIGGKGLFIKELEHALMEGTIDMAVHSMKDVPAEMPDGLVISAVSKREDPRDVLVLPEGKSFEKLGQGAVIGTSSARREVQILQKKTGLQVKPLRGNVLTRIEKLLNNEFDAIMLAAAGLKRLGLEYRCSRYFDVDDIIPAVGQGVLGIETRKDYDIDFLLESIHCEASELQLSAERAFMVKLDGGCSTPIAAHAVIAEDRMKVYGMYAEEDRSKIYRVYVEGEKNSAKSLGEKLADMVLEQRGGQPENESR